MTEIKVVQSDITKFEADAIVNAANSSLLGGSGVDGAIHRAAGKDLLFACRLLGGCKPGQAKITPAFNISTAAYIIHTVGPYYKGLEPEHAEELLSSCYRNSLDLAFSMDSIAFPAIATGIYGYPLEEATQIAIQTINEWLKLNSNTALKTITLIAYDQRQLNVMKLVLHKNNI